MMIMVMVTMSQVGDMHANDISIVTTMMMMITCDEHDDEYDAEHDNDIHCDHDHGAGDRGIVIMVINIEQR